MSVFREGWVCPQCWVPNRASDGRCYSCKFNPWPTEQGGSPEHAESWAPARGRASEQTRVIPAPIAVLVVPAGVIFWLYGVLTLVGAALVFVGAWLSAMTGGATSFVFMFPLGVVLAVFGWLWYMLGRKVLAGRRWAWIVGILVTAPPLVLQLFLLSRLPESVAAYLPSWHWVTYAPSLYICVVLLLALISDTLTRAGLRRRESRTAKRMGLTGATQS